MIVADTSPLNYLVWIGAVEVLPELYERVLIPDIVLTELRHEKTPTPVTAWLAKLPSWIEVHPALMASRNQRLEQLDAGERAAILLAEAQSPPALLVMDEIKGRAEAARRKIPITGTLGVLQAAARRGWLDLPVAFARLRETTFHSPAALMNDLLAQDARRKRKP